MEESDANAWVAMRNRLWPHHGSLDVHAHDIEAYFAGSVSPTLTAAFIAVDNGEPVGFIELALRPYATGCDSSPVPYVEGWFVEAPHRARGIGKALMHASETWARAAGFTELASDAHLDNDDSLRAHLGCGFSVTERMIIFRKSLAPPSPEQRFPHLVMPSEGSRSEP